MVESHRFFRSSLMVEAHRFFRSLFMAEIHRFMAGLIRGGVFILCDKQKSMADSKALPFLKGAKLLLFGI